MEYRGRFYSAVEISCSEVPEDLGPDEALHSAAYLISCSGEDDQAGPVVFDQSPHCDEIRQVIVGVDAEYLTSKLSSSERLPCRDRGLSIDQRRRGPKSDTRFASWSRIWNDR